LEIRKFKKKGKKKKKKSERRLIQGKKLEQKDKKEK